MCIRICKRIGTVSWESLYPIKFSIKRKRWLLAISYG